MRSLRLELELLRWRMAGKRALLWWRDDDAAGPSGQLVRLLSLSKGFAVPLTLAVIPTGDMDALAKMLAIGARVTVVQHGIDHKNRRSGRVAGEFPRDWTRDRLKAELARGWDRMAPLPGAAPVFVPPWNDVHPDLDGALGDLGYGALSANGALGSDGFPRLDVHIDLLRWRGGARFRGHRRFEHALCGALALRRQSGRWSAPIGLLTHHLDHDEAAWAFLRNFLIWSRDQSALDWVSLPSLLGGAEPSPPQAPTPRLVLVADGSSRS